MITSTITAVTYENGKRLETVVNEYMPSDDTMKLGQLQSSLGQRLAKKEQILPLYDRVATGDNAGIDKASLDRDLERLEAEIAACRELIAAQQEYISGYEKEKK